MSHFTVLVIGDNVDEQLAPYHEFECTGRDDEYVQDIDVTDEAREEYESSTKPEIQTFYDFVKWWYGSEPVYPDEDIDFENRHKYGYMLMDERANVVQVVKRTNPNAKWDWYKIGGRWTGFFKLKPGKKGVVGDPGFMTEPADSTAGYTDQAKKGDIDFEAVREEKGLEAAYVWDAVHRIADGRDFITWEEARAEHPEDMEKARKLYSEQPVKLDILKSKDNKVRWSLFADDSIMVTSREEWIQKARDRAIVTFAVVKDGEWYEKGKMGWWAVVSDEIDQEEWNRKFSELLDSVSDDTLLTLVDCHI